MTGATGLLGRAVCIELSRRRLSVLGIGRTARSAGHVQILALDLSAISEEETAKLLDTIQPRAIIHFAGPAHLEMCEALPELAEATHLRWPLHAMRWCDRHHIPLVYASSVAVFDGEKCAAYLEQDQRSPLSRYGELKARAEDVLLEFPGSLVFRTAAVFGPGAPGCFCFAEQVLRAAQVNRPVDLFDDVDFAPIDSASLAGALSDLFVAGVRGLVHLAGSERCSRFEFGRRLLRAAGFDPNAARRCKLADRALPVARPRNQVLDSANTARILGRSLPAIDESIAGFLRVLDPPVFVNAPLPEVRRTN